MNRSILASLVGYGVQFLILVLHKDFDHIFFSLINQILNIIYYQIFCIITLGVIGIYYDQRGTAKTVGVMVYAITGGRLLLFFFNMLLIKNIQISTVFNGYYSSKYYKFMGGRHWATNLIVTAIVFPVNYFLQFFPCFKFNLIFFSS